MRINIEVPEEASSGASTSLSQLSNAPPMLVELASSGELVLIELQGSLEIDDAHAEGGQVLGKLEFHDGREDRPTLLISHHRLEGKVESLSKPFAVLQKKKRSEGEREGCQNNAIERKASEQRQARPQQRLDSSPSFLSRQTGTINLAHNDDGNDTGEAVEYLDEEDGLASPSMGRKRARGDKEDEEGHQASAKIAKAAPVALSSSPLPRPPMRGSELDFSSPLPASRRKAPRQDIIAPSLVDEQEASPADDEWLHKKNTSTYFEVVCIIRKKILFTKRPEPVVRLDGEGGEKARLALGLMNA